MKTVFIFVIRAYKLIVSPIIGPRCRFHPSCSDYACEALERHGVIRGLMMSAARLSRCHPFNPGGYDPVP